MKKHSLSGGQIRAARALLRWSVEELAQRTSLGRNTIKRAEAKEGNTSLTAANELAIRHAFEAAGVEFTNGDQPGLRLTTIVLGRSEESPSASDQIIAAKGVRGKTAKATKKKR
jgi:transcriptional regulator with XRE-family HTH domain